MRAIDMGPEDAWSEMMNVQGKPTIALRVYDWQAAFRN